MFNFERFFRTNVRRADDLSKHAQQIAFLALLQREEVFHLTLHGWQRRLLETCTRTNCKRNLQTGLG
jgi:hypothetical protein